MDVKKGRLLVAVLAVFMTANIANAQFVDVVLPGESDFDAWDNLTRTNPQVANADPAFPAFPGAELWPAPIESVLTFGTNDPIDDDPTGDAQFDKVSGNGYPAGISIYTSPFGNGGVFSLSDATPIEDIETLIFQIDIGSGSSFGEFLTGDATLTINDDTDVDLRARSISVAPPFDSGFGPVPIGTLRYQWDLRGLGPISSFDVFFETAGTSSTILALQLDQGDTFALVIPEPTSLIVLGLSSAILCCRRRGGASRI